MGLPGAHPWRVLLGAALENLDSLDVAGAILSYGVCDRSSLGVAGLYDGLPGGVHIDPHRAERMRRHTQPALAPADLLDRPRLQRMDARALAHLGRLSKPYVRRPGDRGFEMVDWSEALQAIGDAVPKPKGSRMAFLAGPDGLSIEAAYTFAKAARLLTATSVSLCPADAHDTVEASLERSLGVSRATASLEDLLEAQLILVVGSHLAVADARAVSLLLAAKRRGARVVVLNPIRERALSHVWTGSDLRSALFGTRLTDDFVEVAVGGDAAFFAGVNKAILERGGQEAAFVTARTEGIDELTAALESLSWDELSAAAGCPRRDMEWVAELAVRAERAVTVVGTGLTRGPGAAPALESILDLHLLRGFFGQDGSGVLPLAASAGTLGARACGLHSGLLPGPAPVGPGPAAILSQHWDKRFVPTKPGRGLADLPEAAAAGALDLLVCMGADPVQDLPHSDALAEVPVRVHLDTVVRPSMLADAGALVVLLPVTGFYGQDGGSTVLTADGRVRISPPLQYGAGVACDPWQALHAIATQLDPDLDEVLDYPHAGAIREEIDACVPALAGIGGLKAAGEWVRPGGRHAGTERSFPCADGRARFGAPTLSPRPALQVVARKSLPTGTPGRDTILLSETDAGVQGITSGDTVELTTEHGVYRGAACVMHMPAGAAHVCMPEAGALLPRVPGSDPVVVTLRRRS